MRSHSVQRCFVRSSFADSSGSSSRDTGVPYGWEYGAFAASRRAAYFALTSRAPSLTPHGPKQPVCGVSSRTPARVT